MYGQLWLLGEWFHLLVQARYWKQIEDYCMCYREFPLLTLQWICIGHAINIWTEGMMCNDWQLWWMLVIYSSLNRHSFICDRVSRIYWLLHTIRRKFFLGTNIVTDEFFFLWIYCHKQNLQVFNSCFFSLFHMFLIHLLICLVWLDSWLNYEEIAFQLLQAKSMYIY